MTTTVFIAGFVGLVAIAAATYGGVWLLVRSRLAPRLMDRPNERSSHTEATPRGGGILIVVVTIAAISAYSAAVDGAPDMRWVSGAASLVALVSVLDDMSPIKHYLRFAVHLVAAGLVVYATGGFTLLEVPLVGGLPMGILGPIASLLWIVWMTNAFNFMDGIDGIAGLQAVIGGIAIASVAAVYSEPSITAFGLIVSASSFGFLLHNWQPARIFMGDVGSAFLGFLFATFPLLLIGRTGGHDSRIPIIAVTLVWLFVFDALVTLFHRASKLEKIWTPHREHIYQRLVRAGWPHAAVALFYGIGSALTAAALVAALVVHERFFFILSGIIALTTAGLLVTFANRRSLSESLIVSRFSRRVDPRA
jgi:UDP-N-acetylmuramyl pentapeptide phosphotransferase/UDP-N-acetylglucosamine-1-phosphate transferase